MSYELPNPTFPTEEYAKSVLTRGKQFKLSVAPSYMAAYEDVWKLNRPEVTMTEMQAIIDRAGAPFLQMLSEAAAYVAGIASAFPGKLPEKYHTSPYEYDEATLQTEGRLVLLGLKPEWQPVAEEDSPGEASV